MRSQHIQKDKSRWPQLCHICKRRPAMPGLRQICEHCDKHAGGGFKRQEKK